MVWLSVFTMLAHAAHQAATNQTCSPLLSQFPCNIPRISVNDLTLETFLEFYAKGQQGAHTLYFKSYSSFPDF